MLFNRLDDETGQYTKNASYLLASLFCLSRMENGQGATLGIRQIAGGHVITHELFYSQGEDNGCAVPIRSAVILRPDVTIKEEGEVYKID